MRRFSVFLLLSSAGVLPAQSPPLTGPVEGFTFDVPTKSFRAVIGALGSASLGPALLENLDYGSAAPRKNYGIAFQDGQCMVVSALDSAQVSTTVLSASISVPEGIAWSGDGSVAILYSRKGNWVQMIRGLPDAPEPGAPVNVSELGGSLSAVAADLRGEHIAVALGGETAGLYRLADGPSLVPLMPLSKPIALAFSNDGGTLYALDGATKQLSALQIPTFSSESWPLEGVEDPVAIGAVSDSNQRKVVYVASGKDRLLIAYDTSSHELAASLPLDFEPTIIETLGRNSFLLGARVNDGEPLWSFTTAPQPTVNFIPVAPAAQPEETGK